MELSFTTRIIHWRGPAPFFYAPLPPAEAEEVRRVSKLVTYGWGMIPVEATINGVTFSTAMFRKNDTYYLPLKDAVRRQCGVTADDVVAVAMTLQPPRR
ncbi:MAG TPA: DUF1905 domain-containing protein [Devosia sp.]